ncbi:MAG: spore photoproduct lyase family protein [Pseudomonadota bacterium]
MGQENINSTDRFEQLAANTAFARLAASEQEFLREQSRSLRFTQQEIQQLSDISLDRQQWKEAPLAKSWPAAVRENDQRRLKKRLLAQVREAHENLKSTPRDYLQFDKKQDTPPTQKPILKVEVKPQLGLGRCPVASERTRCCNLLTLDAVEKCGFDCSYCSIQSFYHGNEVVFDQGFSDKLRNLKLDPDKTYHIGTGQSSDSLMWGNKQGVLEALCDFAERNPNVILELKTKSKNIGWLLKNDYPANILCTWSLNPQTIIDHEEHRSASLSERLDCAEKITAKGRLVGFHFHPIIAYQGWHRGYEDIGEQLTERFDPASVALVSMGTLTYAKSVMKTIRQRPFKSKILQMPLVETAGKYSYPTETKLDMFQTVYRSLRPWHAMVFFYLCMEPADLWQPVFGFQYENNIALEKAMKQAYLDKIVAL